MMGSLEGRKAIVTGGGRGIGRAIAIALATEGADVGAVGRTAETLTDTTDVAGAEAFLSGPGSNFVHGHLLFVNGGYTSI